MKERLTIVLTVATLMSLATPMCASAQPIADQEEMTELDRLRWMTVLGEVLEFRGEGPVPLWASVVAHTALDAINLRTLPAYRYVGETGRTDKQVGSTSTSMGTTSLLEKPGIPALIALAIERGAIQEEHNGTSATLRSSPASLFKLAYRSRNGRIAEDEPLYAWLNRLGFSATLPIEESGSGGDNFDFSEVREWSSQLNLNFWGDRTTHSPRFIEKWNQSVGPAIDQRLKDESKLVDIAFNETEGMVERARAVRRAASSKIRDILEPSATHVNALELGLSPSEAIERLRADPIGLQLYAVVTSELETQIAEPIRAGTLVIPNTTRAKLAEKFADLIDSHAALAKIKEDLRTDLEDVLMVPMFTAEYTNHRSAMGSNFSEAKLFLQHRLDLTTLVLFPEPFDLIWNANASFYHHPEESMGQESVRDFGFSLGAEFSFDNPLVRFLSEADLSSITFLFAGRFSRLESQDDEAGFVQGKLEIPVAGGMTIPLAITYATRTEENNEDEVRGNLGFSFDIDKLYALAQFAMLR